MIDLFTGTIATSKTSFIIGSNMKVKITSNEFDFHPIYERLKTIEEVAKVTISYQPKKEKMTLHFVLDYYYHFTDFNLILNNIFKTTDEDSPEIQREYDSMKRRILNSMYRNSGNIHQDY